MSIGIPTNDKKEKRNENRKLDYTGKDTEEKLLNPFIFAVKLSAFSYSAIGECATLT